jgi:hypothetical protein
MMQMDMAVLKFVRPVAINFHIMISVRRGLFCVENGWMMGFLGGQK